MRIGRFIFILPIFIQHLLFHVVSNCDGAFFNSDEDNLLADATNPGGEYFEFDVTESSHLNDLRTADEYINFKDDSTLEYDIIDPIESTSNNVAAEVSEQHLNVKIPNKMDACVQKERFSQLIFFQRMANRLNSSLSSSGSFVLYFDLSEEDIHELRNFARKPSLEKINELMEIFFNSVITFYSSDKLYFTKFLESYMNAEAIYIAVASLACIVLCSHLFLAIWRKPILLLLVIFSVSYCINYISNIMKIQISNEVIVVENSGACDNTYYNIFMGFINGISIKKNQCVRRMEALTISAFLQVSPFEVFFETLFSPLVAFLKTLNKGSFELFHDLPFTLWPFVIIFVVILLFFIFQYRISTPLASIGPSPSDSYKEKYEKLQIAFDAMKIRQIAPHNVGALKEEPHQDVTRDSTVDHNIGALKQKPHHDANHVSAVDHNVGALKQKPHQDVNNVSAVDHKFGAVKQKPHQDVNNVSAVDHNVGAIKQKAHQDLNNVSAVDHKFGAVKQKPHQDVNNVSAVDHNVGAIKQKPHQDLNNVSIETQTSDVVLKDESSY